MKSEELVEQAVEQVIEQVVERVVENVEAIKGFFPVQNSIEWANKSRLLLSLAGEGLSEDFPLALQGTAKE